jgi:tetratricopeptide (TPR) repeat protein
MKKTLFSIVTAVVLVFAFFAASIFGDSDQAMKYRQLGDMQHKKGDFAGAIESYSRAIKEEPDHPIPYLLRANEECVLKDFKAGLKDCDTAISKAEKLIFNIKVNGILSLVKDKNAMEKSKNDAREMELAMSQMYLMRGKIKLTIEDMKGAKADFDKAIAIDGNMAEFYVLRAMHGSRVKDNKAALADMDKAISLEPENAQYYALRSDAKRDLGDNTGAMEDLQKSLEIKPGSTAYNNLADIKNVAGDYKGALKEVNNAIKLEPKHGAAYCTRGEIKSNMKDYAGAIKDFKKAISLAGNEERLKSAAEAGMKQAQEKMKGK